ncbi:MAG: TIGR01777 family protein, partial [Nitrospirales bacterium]
MKIVIAGGTGFIGRHLCQLLVDEGHSIIVLSRHPDSTPASANTRARVIQWNGREDGTWATCCDGAEVVINLSGAPIADKRWTPERKHELMDSRVLTTQTLLASIAKWNSKPHTFITASGVGFYGDRESDEVNEDSPRGRGFLAELCHAWEAAAKQGEALGLRVLPVRFGMVLGPNGGALPKMAFPFRFFLGGPVLPGSQFVSWIHLTDLSRLILWLITNPWISGPVNGVAPDPVTMREFCERIGQTMRRPSWFPVPGFLLR